MTCSPSTTVLSESRSLERVGAMSSTPWKFTPRVAPTAARQSEEELEDLAGYLSRAGYETASRDGVLFVLDPVCTIRAGSGLEVTELRPVRIRGWSDAVRFVVARD